VSRWRVDRLGHAGDGVIAGADGPLYAAFALPGETVEGAPAGDRLAVARVVEPSPARRSPPCPHFGRCGGCALQHADDAFLADWKTRLVADALAARGLSAPLRPIRVSPPGARRRAAFSARRTRKGVALGFHEAGDESAIASVETCAVLDPAIVAALPALREAVAAAASRSGALRVVATASQAGLDVALAGAKPPDRAMRERLAAVAEAADWARLAVDGEVVALRRPPFHAFGRARVAPPPGGFLQATRQGEAAIVAAVREAVGDAATVADLYAGAGALTLPLAERAAVTAWEGEAGAVAALDAGWRAAPGLRAVTAHRRDLVRRPVEAATLARFEAVVIDPPRAGAAPQTAEIAQARPPRVACVSCNPATLARDLRVLADAGYRLDWAQPIDQFRWSRHVEAVVALSRR